MPSKSPAQRRLMAAVAHGWKPTRIKAPPLGVAKEFARADAAKRKRKAAGGLLPPRPRATIGRVMPRQRNSILEQASARVRGLARPA